MAEQHGQGQHESQGQTSFPSGSDNMSLSDSSSSGTGFYYPERVEGYDYEFVPTPDPKYECAICLLILREPRQTKCGHRFCRDCITKWLRESESRCPVDNEAVEERELFADNFAKREIQNFKVRCPNSKEGCEVLVTLKNLKDHTDQCPLALVPCPNQCMDVLLRRDIPNHIEFNCTHRLLRCPHCNQEVPAEQMERHMSDCPLVKVECPTCGNVFERHEMETHHQSACPKKLVPCDFAPLGCTAVMNREDLAAHGLEAMADHQKLLCKGMVVILNRLGISHISSDSAVTDPSMNRLTPTEISAVESMLSHFAISSGSGMMSGVSKSADAPLTRPLSADYPSTDLDAQKLYRSQSESAMKVTSDTVEEDPLTYSSKPSGSLLKGAVSIHQMQEPREEIRSLKNQNLFQDESLARHDQLLMEIQAKNEMLEKTNKELKHRMKHLDNAIQDFEGRACNGQYYWRIKNYSKLRHEAELGINTALHSPSFYSSCYGYKLCIRGNLNGVDTARGNYLSIFIHFMQGEWDDILDWPFSGQIILSVIDQGSQTELRRHVTETLIAKPTLAAFQRPTTPRNHKGFGYMEFVPQSVLDNGGYVRNDTLIIKAKVVPNTT